MRLVDSIGKAAQSFSNRAHSGDRLPAHLRNDRVVDVGDGVAQLHLDQLNSFFNAPAYATWSWARRRICAHGFLPLLATK